MSFLIKDDEVLEKYEQIWDLLKNKLKIKFRSLPVYDKKYLKTKVRRYEDMIKTNLLGNGMPKEKICIMLVLLALLLILL